MDLEKKQVTATKRIMGLDGLRGLSILLVILYHFFPRVVKGGYLGVPLLFILSGYLLSSLDTKKWHRDQYSIQKESIHHYSYLLDLFHYFVIYFYQDY